MAKISLPTSVGLETTIDFAETPANTVLFSSMTADAYQRGKSGVGSAIIYLELELLQAWFVVGIRQPAEKAETEVEPAANKN